MENNSVYHKSRFKYFTLPILGLTLILSGVLSLFYYFEETNQKSNLLLSEINTLQMQKREIYDEFNATLRDLFFLANQSYWNEVSNEAIYNKINSKDIYFKLVRNRYSHLVYLTARGQNRITISSNQKFDSKKPVLISQSNNTNILTQPLVTPAPPDKKNNAVTTNFNFSTPVYNKQGIPQGALLLNFSTLKLINKLQSLHSSHPGTMVILSSQDNSPYSYPIYSANNQNEIQEKKHQFPTEFSKILNLENGQFTTQNGLFTFDTIHPLEKAQQIATTSGLSRHDAINVASQKNIHWKLVSIINRSHINELTSAIAVKYGLLFAIFMIGNVVGCYIFATIRSEQQQIKLNNQKLSQALAHSPVSFVITDTRGVIEYVNPEFENISGYSFQELKGNTPALLQSGKTPPSTYKQMWESIKSGNKWEGEFINLRKNKTLFVEKATIAPLFNASGEIINFIGIKSDISEIKYAEADIKLSKLEAENASAAKTEFISNMSHELRTPLNAILGFSEALLDENLNQQTGKEQLIFAQHIHQSSLHLLDLVNDIMELSQIENQNINLQIEPFCLEHLLDETVTTFSHEYKNKDLILTTIDHDIPEKLKGDKRRIRQVISNLLDNGIRYSGGQMVTMKVTAPQKSKTIIKLRIEINDRGPGIPADKQKIIFNKFATLNTVSHTERRSGLGLTICKELTSKMDGEIGLFSKPGIGTTFWIELPLGVCDKLEVAESERACSTRNTSSLNIFNNKHILVTEDDKVNQLLIKHILTKLGCRVTICENGLEALKCLSKEVCDLVLMDCQMPLMDGYETTKRFRNSIEFDHSIPVIALTANSIRGDREKCLAAGMNDYLSKPINRELLTETMARWLMKRKGSS